MKKLNIFAVLTAFFALMAMSSCEKYEESFFVAGNLSVKDSLIYIESEIDYVCYDFAKTGEIIAHTEGHTDEKIFSYNFQMIVVEETVFPASKSGEYKISSGVVYFQDNKASFSVSLEGETKSVEISVPGANFVTINSRKVLPCKPFHAKLKLENKGIQTINDIECYVAIVTATFINGEGDAVRNVQHRLSSPVKKENVRVVTINKEFVDDKLIVTSNIDNSILEDTTNVVEIPLLLTLSCEGKKEINARSFDDFKVEGTPSETSKKSLKEEVARDGKLTVTYNKFESKYYQFVSASGNSLKIEQTVQYNNEFVAKIEGEELRISLPVALNVDAIYNEKDVVKNETIIRQQNIKYKASIASLEATAVQKIDVIVKAISFDGQKVDEVYRTITFKDHGMPLVYDCVLSHSKSDESVHYFHYREIVNDHPEAWVSEKLTASKYHFIIDGKNKSGKYALSIYYHKNHGMEVGYLTDKCPEEVVYWAEGKEPNTLMGSRFVFLGDLNTAIAGTWVAEGNFIKLVSANDVIYNNITVCKADEIYFY